MQQHSRRLQANLALLLPFGSIPLPFEKLIKILKKNTTISFIDLLFYNIAEL